MIIGPVSGAVFALLALIIDLNLHLEFAAGVLYVISIALTAMGRQPKYIAVMACVCLAFTLLGYVLSLPVEKSVIALTNRGFAVFAIIVVAVVALGYCRAEKMSAKKEDIYQAMFNQTFQFVAALDSGGNIIEANQTLRDYAGLATDEIESVPLWLLPIFQSNPEIQEHVQSLVDLAKKGNFSRDEFTITGIGDHPTIIDFSLKPIRGSDGAVEQMIMEARDITEARTQQEMLVQAQKMEAVGELTAGVAHDFNNLLTVIVGNLEILQKRLGDSSGAQDRLRRAIEAAFRGQSLTQQLLAFSRRQALNPAVIDITTIIEGMRQIFDALSDNISVEFDLADGLPPCDVDPTLLETALLNIAINARDAMPDGGTLRIETAHTEFDQAYQGEITDLPPGDYVCLALTDSGDGMAEETKSQVFEPFFTTKPVGKGTGLGLSMVYGFVRQSGGDVKIYSELGEGTTIRIYLPTTDKPLPQPAEIEGNANSALTEEGGRVLLVDDDDEVRDIILNTLADFGFSVETAKSGEAAIDLILAGNAYDLIFTDMVMEGETGGSDVARAARSVMPDVPVIFCSGFPRQTLENEEASVDGALFLAKPFQRGPLVDILNKALGRATA